MTMSDEAEIGTTFVIDGISTNVQLAGTEHDREPVLLLHGSGPGVTAYANWRLAIPYLSKHRPVVAPDLYGFGYTDPKASGSDRIEDWTTHLLGLLDRLEFERVAVIGNSFGGAVALRLALEHPARISRAVLMGSVGTHFELTPGLDAVWGYQPSVEAMRTLIELFAFDPTRFPADLAELRYRASIRPGSAEAYSTLFPAPRQQWIDALALSDDQLAALPQDFLIIHGREDKVIPVGCSIALSERIDRAQLHVFSHCGHWVQLEQSERFHRLVENFLDE
jgi:2-hydroxymuconate-semialdehyde hydrolase